tara:strand:+ start:857 stop:1102 length:246 start_codon:yes stop_codon:yes gene_type:complete
MENKKDYFYMLLRDVSINALALEKEEAFVPSCDEIDALEALHDAMDFRFNRLFLPANNHSATKEDWLHLQREYPAIERTKA